MVDRREDPISWSWCSIVLNSDWAPLSAAIVKMVESSVEHEKTLNFFQKNPFKIDFQEWILTRVHVNVVEGSKKLRNLGDWVEREISRGSREINYGKPIFPCHLEQLWAPQILYGFWLKSTTIITTVLGKNLGYEIGEINPWLPRAQNWSAWYLLHHRAIT